MLKNISCKDKWCYENWCLFAAWNRSAATCNKIWHDHNDDGGMTQLTMVAGNDDDGNGKETVAKSNLI